MAVFCYRNLNRKGVVWSVRDKKSGLVVDRQPTVYIQRPVFRVSRAGRVRVLKEQRKNVHAGVQGERRNYCPMAGQWVRVSYNPYKLGSFVTESGEPIHEAIWAKLTPNGCFALVSWSKGGNENGNVKTGL